jgi:hypothetical protein
MFDQNYYNQKRNKLISRRQILCQKYIDAAFEFTTETTEINKELMEIDLWEKQQPVKKEEPIPSQPETKPTPVIVKNPKNKK